LPLAVFLHEEVASPEPSDIAAVGIVNRGVNIDESNVNTEGMRNIRVVLLACEQRCACKDE